MSAVRSTPWIVAAILVTVAAQAEAQPAKVLDPHRVAELRSVGQAVISPTGAHVAYTVSTPRRPGIDEDGPAWSHLYVYDVGGDSTRLFVGGAVNVSRPAFGAGGSSLFYVARRDGDDAAAVYEIALSGGESRRVAAHETSVSAFSVHPEGSRLAFLAADAEPEERADLRERGFKAVAFEEDLRFTRVRLTDTEGPEESRRTSTLELEGHASFVSWSPNGEHLLVAIAPTPLIDDSYMQRRLRVVDAETGQVVQRIDNPGKLGRTAWSPDSRSIAFVSAETIHDPKEGRLVVADVATGSIRDVVPGFEGHFTDVEWSDARAIVYLADTGSTTEIGQVRADGSERRTLFTGPAFTSIDVSEDGRRMALVGDAPTHPPELFVLSAGSDAPRRVTNTNPWLADVPLAPQEIIRWTARDGLEIEGILIRPLNEVEGRRYPLIVHVHGGPESHNRNGWLTSYSRPGQVAAARGMAVLYPNYRASTGRGVEFSMLDHGDMAGGEFDDIVDGVDHLIEIGLADEDRIGVTGGSYGGYATAWLSTYYSDRFAAGVMSVGISNQISKVGTSDIPDEMYLVHNRLRPWDDWELFLERSPIYWADRARTPLLILHGTEDRRVHPGQSMEMYRHLKLRGQAPVRLIFYPGEGHGNRNAAARLDYSLRSLRWMEHYLLGPGGDMPDRDLDYSEDSGSPTASRTSPLARTEQVPAGR